MNVEELQTIILDSTRQSTFLKNARNFHVHESVIS